MKVPSSLLIAIFPILSGVMADWNEFNPLILVSTSHVEDEFPDDVRQEDGKIMYYKDNQPIDVSRIRAYCASPHENYNYFQKTIEGNGQSSTSIKIDPDEKCEKPPVYEIVYSVNPQVQVEINGSSIYEIQYKLNQGTNEVTSIKYLIIYTICISYEYTTNPMKYGFYTIRNPKLLINESLKEEQNYQVQSDHESGTPFFVPPVIFQIMKDAYARGKLEDDSYMYSRKPILPTDWLPYGHQRRPLHHFANSAPMNTKYIQFWDELMMKLKNKIVLFSQPIQVYAGVERLRPLNELVHPCDWWVSIHQGSEGVVVMMDTCPSKDLPGVVTVDVECNEDICREAGLSDVLIQNADKEEKSEIRILCCSPTFINNVTRVTTFGDSLLKFSPPQA